MTESEIQKLLWMQYEIIKKNLEDEGISVVASCLSDFRRAEIVIIAYQEEEQEEEAA